MSRPPVRVHGLRALLVSLLSASAAGAATWIVDPAGGGNATTIQQGVGLAAAGDVVLVRAGVYPEQVTVDRALTITGESGAEATTIDAESTRPYCLTTTASGVVIEGLTLTGVNAGYGFCTGEAALVAVNMEIRECRIVGNVSETATVWLDGGTNRIVNTEFVGNEGVWPTVCGGPTDPDHATGCIRAIGELVIERCLFENNRSLDNAILDIWGRVTIRNCVIRGHLYGALFVASYDDWALFRFENNLFVDNDCPLFGWPYYGNGLQYDVEVVNNTFARNTHLFTGQSNLAPGSIFHANVFTGSNAGFWLPAGATGVTVTCNDSWGNQANWIGIDPAPGGNFSLEPKYCAPLQDEFRVAANSPLLPANNPCGIPVGAFGEGCDPVSIEARSWGWIKALHR
jgi:hypothetical protein